MLKGRAISTDRIKGLTTFVKIPFPPRVLKTIALCLESRWKEIRFLRLAWNKPKPCGVKRGLRNECSHSSDGRVQSSVPPDRSPLIFTYLSLTTKRKQECILKKKECHNYKFIIIRVFIDGLHH